MDRSSSEQRDGKTMLDSVSSTVASRLPWLVRFRQRLGRLTSETPRVDGGERRFWLEPGLVVLLGLVCLCYGLRLSQQPIRGEESRWAQGAREMITTGDWIVPRQQGQVFPERPPMNSWLMALSSWLVGGMTPFAVRLPSVLATLLTTIVVWGYVRSWLGSEAALACGVVFATSGQVLQLGRLGESEAVLTACVTVSLLGWHALYRRGSVWLAWQVGFFAAGVAALTKGVQGPVYFVAVTSVFLVLRGELRFWLSPAWWCGLLTLCYTILIWLVPFWSVTDLQAVRDVWTGLIADRVGWGGFLEHLGSYPVETLGCLLPWSVFLVPLYQRAFRQRVMELGQPIGFALVALAVTYPSVWLVTGARGRYFMPLYPMAGIGLGIVIWQSWVAVAGSWGERGWRRFLVAMSLVGVGLAGVSGAALAGVEWLEPIAAVRSWLVLLLVVGVTTAAVLGVLLRRVGREGLTWEGGSAIWGLSATAVLVGVAYMTIAINRDLEHGDPLATLVDELRVGVLRDEQLISFGPVHHRFGYHWGDAVEQRAWPEVSEEVPGSTDYFCLDYNLRDTAEVRVSGRGRSWSTTSGTLPFAWEEVTRVPIDREYQESYNWVIIGRIKRDESGRPIVARTPIQPAANALR